MPPAPPATRHQGARAEVGNGGGVMSASIPPIYYDPSKDPWALPFPTETEKAHRVSAAARDLIHHRTRLSGLETELRQLKRRKSFGEHALVVFRSIKEAMRDTPLSIQATHEPRLPIFVDHLQARRVVPSHVEATEGALSLSAETFAAIQAAQCFVLGHDWAAAMASASDLHERDYPLPYPVCAFEMTISGVFVIAIRAPDHGDINLTAIGTKSGWHVIPEDPEKSGILELIESQIRALCIVLDAGIAVAELIRQPHSATLRPSASRKALPKNYRVVRLNRSSRADRAPSQGETRKRRVRLHFRRGHWRHFAARRVWIKWMLVGDPDLGLVDKHYSL
jgi:hypothetical protein